MPTDWTQIVGIYVFLVQGARFHLFSWGFKAEFGHFFVILLIYAQ